MSSPCQACGSDPGVAFTFCPHCGVARRPDVATEAVSPAAAPTSLPSVVAFDRPGSFYQPVDSTLVERAIPAPLDRVMRSGVAPWVAAERQAIGSPADDPGPTPVARSLSDYSEAALLYLVVRQGPDFGMVRRIITDLLVGRAADAGLVLSDPGVSERHGWVRRGPEMIRFEAVDPSAATLVRRDGSTSQATGREALSDGDTVILGATHLRIVVIDAPRARG